MIFLTNKDQIQRIYQIHQWKRRNLGRECMVLGMRKSEGEGAIYSG